MHPTAPQLKQLFHSIQLCPTCRSVPHQPELSDRLLIYKLRSPQVLRAAVKRLRGVDQPHDRVETTSLWRRCSQICSSNHFQKAPLSFLSTLLRKCFWRQENELCRSASARLSH